MEARRLICVAITAVLALLPATAWARDWTEMGITAPQMAQYFQQHAGPNDIARVDHPSDIGLIANITVGRKMVIFKSVSEIETFMRSNANSLDIIGYNLEPRQTHSAAELANPVAAAKAAKAVAVQHGKLLAIGLTKSLTNQYGPSMAPYADIWILQVQKAQDDPQQVVAWVQPMSEALKAANPSVQIAVQIRTDSQPAALASLVNSMAWLEGVSILTQRSDVQDAVNVAAVFFGGQAQTVGQAPASWVNDYGYRLPSKDGKWLLPVATRLLGSTDDDHVHRGSINSWDLSAAIGSPVFAAAAGTVEAAGYYLYENHKWSRMQGYGGAIEIKHGNGISSQYGHCLEGSIRVKAGDQVTANTLLCQVGKTGVTSFNHTHFTILRNGSPVRMDSIFDKGKMRYCHLCSGKNDPKAPIGNSMVTSQPQAQPQTTVMATRYDQLLAILRQYPPQLVSLAVMVILGALVLVYWLGGKVERIAIIAGVSGMAGAAVIVWLFMPIGVVAAQPTNAGQQTAISGGEAAFEKALSVTLKREGSGCDTYIVRTLNGVTQWTYDRYRKEKGLPKADVCASLKESEWRYIYYNYYWLPSGASKLPINAAIPVFDHFVNAGRKINGCGDNVKCINQQRKDFYLSTADCGRRTSVCKAWLDRVEYIRRLTEGA